MRSILIVFAHPSLEKSRVHRSWIDSVKGHSGLTFHDLYEEYPEFDIDIARDQALLQRHDVVVLQFPLYWYSTPALLKQWLDLVLEYGWAYGKDGTALEGKGFMVAISTGGAESAYQPEGFHEITIPELLAPLKQTARLCRLMYLPPFITHDAFVMTEDDVERSAQRYLKTLIELRDSATTPEAGKEPH